MSKTLRVLFAFVSAVVVGLAVPATHANAQNSPTITEFPVPQLPSGQYPGPYGITSGPDGNIWFTGWDGQSIGRITPSGTITQFPIPGGGNPFGITSGPDGNLWFTDSTANTIGRITPSGVITEFNIPTGGSDPTGITLGPDGNLWFAEELGDQIGRITPSGVITEFPVPNATSPFNITKGPDGALWFTLNNSIGRITTSGVVTEFLIPNAGGNLGPFGAEPIGITTGADGDLWFTEYFGGYIGQLDPVHGVINQYLLPSSLSAPYDITSGPDGNLWFTTWGYGTDVGQLSTTGVLTEVPLPARSAEGLAITSGPDGNVWFAQYGGGFIGRINLSGTGSTPPAPASTTVTVTATSPAYAGQNVTLTATVAGGAATPGGTVQFEVGGSDLGPAQPLTNGVATYTTSAFVAGTADVSAAYTPSDVTQWNPSAGSFTLNVLPSGLSLATSVPQGGSFALTIDTTDPVTLTASGYTATGSTAPIVVSETRNYYPGWSVSGQDSSWTGSGPASGGSFSGDQLGWEVTSTTTPLTPGVTLGAKVTPASPGLGDTAAVLASAPAGVGNGFGTTTLVADLTLAIPPTAPAGPYDSGLTITAVSSSP